MIPGSRAHISHPSVWVMSFLVHELDLRDTELHGAINLSLFQSSKSNDKTKLGCLVMARDALDDLGVSKV